MTQQCAFNPVLSVCVNEPQESGVLKNTNEYDATEYHDLVCRKIS